MMSSLFTRFNYEVKKKNKIVQSEILITDQLSSAKKKNSPDERHNERNGFFFLFSLLHFKQLFSSLF